MEVMESLTYEQMEEWLKTKDPSDIVGRARMACDCPVANCVRELGLMLFPFACDIHVRDQETRNRMPALPWQQLFIRAIDHMLLSKITAAKALMVLQSVKERLKWENALVAAKEPGGAP